MVYSSDFYTSRRPAYYKPSTSYSITTPRYTTSSYPVTSSVPEVRRQQYEYVVEQRTTSGGPGGRSYTTTERVEKNNGPGGLTIERSTRSSDGRPGGYHSSYSSTRSGGRPGTYNHFSYNPIYSSDGYDIPPSYYKAHQVYQTSPFILTPITTTARPSSKVLPYNYRYIPAPTYHHRTGAAIHGVLDKIEHRHRSHPGHDATDEYLNTRSATNFDDVTRSIRAQTAGLLKQVYAPSTRPKPSHSHYNTYTGYMELPIAQRIESDAYIEAILRDSQNHHYDTIGKGHLACVTYAGGRAISRRRPRLSGDAEVDNNVTMLSYYNKTREAAAASSGRPRVKVDTPAKTSSRGAYDSERTARDSENGADKVSNGDEYSSIAAEEATRKAEQKRLAVEEAARKEEEDRLAAEEAARKEEEERLAAEEAARKEEEERLAAEEAARKEEEERLAAEAALKEEERLAAEEAALRAEEERLAAKAEEERLAAEAALKEEEERLAAEEAALKEEEERLAAEAEAARKAEEEERAARKLAEENASESEESDEEEVEDESHTKLVTTEVRSGIGGALANDSSAAASEHHEEAYTTLEEVDGGRITTAVFRRTTRKTTTSTVIHSGSEDHNGVEIEELVENEEVSGDEDAVADGQASEQEESSDEGEEIKTEGADTKGEEESSEEEEEEEEEE